MNQKITELMLNEAVSELCETLNKIFGDKKELCLFPDQGNAENRKAIELISRILPGISLVQYIDMCDAIICFSINEHSYRHLKKYNKPVYALFGLEDEPDKKIVTDLLNYIGENPERGGLKDTPKRYLKAWEHFTKGYNENPADVLKVFEDGAESYNEMVVVRDIPVYSQCEHHLVPFFGVAHVAYVPNGKIVGLSKIPRVVDIFARRLQVQERLTNQIADALWTNLLPLGVAVVLECRHLCMESRGISQQGHKTITSSMRGVFKDKVSTRNEFMGFIK